MTSSDEERETLRRVLAENGIGEAGDGLHSWRCSYPHIYGPCDCLDGLIGDILAAQRPVWGVQAEALEEAADAMSANSTLWVNGPSSGTSSRAFYSDWLRARARSVRRWATIPAHSHAPDTGMWAGCQACTAGGGG